MENTAISIRPKDQNLVGTENEMVNSPSHYVKGKYEVIEVLEEWNLPFHLANSVKYLARCKDKGKFVEDLEKALWYLRRWLIWKRVSYRESLAMIISSDNFHIVEVAADWGYTEENEYAIYKTLEYIFYGDIHAASEMLYNYIETLRKSEN